MDDLASSPPEAAAPVGPAPPAGPRGSALGSAVPPPELRSADGYPLAYLITFRTYGTWLHGDERGSVDGEHHEPDSTYLASDPVRERWEARRLRDEPVTFDPQARQVVATTVAEVAEHRGWTLLAVNARHNHVHVVVSAAAGPEAVMSALKAWCTRRLCEAGLFERGRRLWARHGSTRYVWDEGSLAGACEYVVEGQDDR